MRNFLQSKGFWWYMAMIVVVAASYFAGRHMFEVIWLDVLALGGWLALLALAFVWHRQRKARAGQMRQSGGVG